MPLIRGKLLREYLRGADVANVLCFGSKYTWNEIRQRIKFSRKPYIFNAIVDIIFGLPVILHVVRQLHFNSSSTGGPPSGTNGDESKIVGIFMADANLGVFCLLVGYIRTYTHVEMFFNQFISMEQKYWKRDHDLSPSYKRKILITKCIIVLFRETGIKILGLVISVVALVIPTLPMNIFAYPPGSWLVSGMRDIGGHVPFWIYIERIVVFCGNCLMWVANLKNGLLICFEMFMGSICLTIAVLRFERMVNIVYGDSSPRVAAAQIERSCLFYRQIQILADFFNKFGSSQLVVMFLCFGSAQTLTFLKLFDLSRDEAGRHEVSGHEYWANVFYFLIFFLTTVCINFFFSWCSQVYDNSRRVLNDMKYRTTGREPRIYNKVRKSLRMIRVNFGNTNFIEKLTPVVFQMFIILPIADLLFIKFKK